MKKLLTVILVLSISLSCVSCAKTEHKTAYSQEFLDLFDTASKITAYDISQSAFDEHFNRVYEKLEYYSKLFDIYNVYENLNNLKVLNEYGSTENVFVDEEIIELINYGIDMFSLTEGSVNIAMGNVLSVWHNYREQGTENSENAQLPTQNELQKASKNIDINSIVVDCESNTISFKDEITVDVGAIAKGFVCEKISDYIKDNNIWTCAVISLGGNVKVLGTKNGKDFNIGVENPFDDDYAAIIKSKNGDSIVTSGSYQRYYTVSGKNYCHIIDTKTLMPADYFESVTVISKNSTLADAISTALFTMNIDDGKNLIENINNNENYDNVYVMWIDKDGNKLYSDDFEKEYL